MFLFRYNINDLIGASDNSSQCTQQVLYCIADILWSFKDACKYGYLVYRSTTVFLSMKAGINTNTHTCTNTYMHIIHTYTFMKRYSRHYYTFLDLTYTYTYIYTCIHTHCMVVKFFCYSIDFKQVV